MGKMKQQLLSESDELSFEQEDYMLESALETYREERQARADSLFDEWITINITDLKKDFIPETDDIKTEFDDFCKECYKQECEDLI